MVVFEETINKQGYQYFKGGKATEPLGQRLHLNDRFIVPIASVVQTQALDAITDHRRVNLFGSTSIETGDSKDAAVAAGTNLVHKGLARTSFESSSAMSYKVVGHAKPATILAVAPAETGTTSPASQTLQCQ